MNEKTYRIPASVTEDTYAYRSAVEKFTLGDMSPMAFRALRVPMGIYEQRESETYMVRIRLPGGLLLPCQAKCVAGLAEEFGNGIVHITTRQDLQIHGVLIRNTPAVLEGLLDVGLSTRGGGGNTVRNISACSRAGVCPDEDFDVTPYVMALTEYLTDDRANFNLPRKFKIAFSGCGTDCALCSVADVGFFAHSRNGIRGFSVYAAGGMGAHSSLAIQIEEFIPADQVFEVAEAIKRVFDKRGDRSDRNKARLRFVLARVGEIEFSRLYREELDQVRSESLSTPAIRELVPPVMPPAEPEPDKFDNPEYTSWRSLCVLPQRHADLFSVRIPVALGDVEWNVFQSLADAAGLSGDGFIRTTQEQDLIFQNVSGSQLPELYGALREIDEAFVMARQVACIACAGASACKLGLCLSRDLAQAIDAELQDLDAPFETHIRISGCPNSCGQHPIAPVGLYGGAVRSDGRLVPVYSVLVRGHTAEGRASLGRSVGRVPSRVIPAMMKEFWIAAADSHRKGETLRELMDRWGETHLRDLASRYSHIPSYMENPEFYRDHEQREDFSLRGRGPGECGAGVMDVIRFDVEEAKKALSKNLLYDAIVCASRALLVTRGLEPRTDREVFAAFSEHLIWPGWVSHRFQDLLHAAIDFKLGDRATLDESRMDASELITRVEELYLSLDSNLQFRVDRLEDAASSESGDEMFGPTSDLDLRGVACPMNFVRAKLQLEQLNTGDTLDILLDDGEPVRNVPASLTEQGHEVLSVVNQRDHYLVRVRKTD